MMALITLQSPARDAYSPEMVIEELPNGHGWTLRVLSLGRIFGKYPTRCDALRAAARSGYRISVLTREEVQP